MTNVAIDYRRDLAAPPGVAKRFAIQTAAIFVDAYRELNAKKLFWITLILSLLVVIAFAFVGINERGVSIFGKTMPGAWNTGVIPRDTFYKFLFTQLAIPIWLGVAAAILALISVGSVFPDFLTGGSIDLYLSKPIGRLRLFLTKYIAGLLFVALQVLVFSLASFVVIGVRGKSWEPGIFLAVPLVVSFFSYIYCVCVLIGIVTRSALAAILVTLLFWFMLYILNSADTGLLFFKAAQEERQARLQSTIDFYQRLIDQQKAQPTTRQSPDMIRNYEFQMKKPGEDKQEIDTTVRQLRWWHNLVTSVKAPLPKTAETVALMSRWLVEPDAITKAQREQSAQRRQRREAWRAAHGSTRPVTQQASPPSPPPANSDIDEDEAREDAMAEITGRKAVKLIGSSLGFETVILAIAAWIFCRRDF